MEVSAVLPSAMLSPTLIPDDFLPPPSGVGVVLGIVGVAVGGAGVERCNGKRSIS